MTQELTTSKNSNVVAISAMGDRAQFVTIQIGGQLFGIPVLLVHDVLQQQRITRVPLAPPEVAGSLNLRGRIVTAINMRRRMGMDALSGDNKTMAVVVENHGEVYSLIVDAVGEVLTLANSDFERNPPTLPASWRDLSAGIFRLKDELMVVLDITRLLNFNKTGTAA
jgi:purine-binding chemotaxis protein CheW